jgi:hypothetical protein
MTRFNVVKHIYTGDAYMRKSDEGLYVLFQDASDLELVLRQRIERQQDTIHRLEEWIAAIADDHSQIPDWIQQEARSILAKGV